MVLNLFFHQHPSEYAEAKGGGMDKEQDFEAKKKFEKKIGSPTLLLCVMAVFPLEMP